ncbi:PAS domain-containing sensor histidine kinase [uncultured Piscinibacter sp.]|uniref:PAS domain-containing sensor histidine kinase n=1 Tax=uncultured Piscinibacter sp. TaxID=1131835 RepID=UPI00262E7E94|nr:PAS domain-containing sensor histidine kinase [uncultured Piscinibacter sp.]
MSAIPQEGTPFDLFDRPIGGILQAAQEAIVMVDEGQRIVALNPAAERMFHCTLSQVLGRSIDVFIPAQHRFAHGAHVREFAASELLQQRMARHRHVTATRLDGSEFPVEITLSRVDMADGRSLRRYFAALVLDLSEERQLREDFDRFKRRLRSVFELAPVAIWIAEKDRIVFANQAAARLFGRPVVGHALHELLEPDSHGAMHEQLERALAGARDVEVVLSTVARADGTRREVEIALAGLPDHGRTTVQMVVADVTQRRLELAELEQSRTTLRRLSTSVVEAREEERRRIARELHDELGQRLTALKMELSALPGVGTVAARKERVEGLMTMLDDTLASVRRISSDLRPMMLDDLGLNAAIEWLAREASRRMGIEVAVRLSENDAPVEDRVATAVFRMVQEALTNVARHARATDATVTLRQHDGELELVVEDNGIGYPQGAMQREGSFGLLGMRERATMLGGRLEYTNAPGSGARLTVRLPLGPRPRPGAFLTAGDGI